MSFVPGCALNGYGQLRRNPLCIFKNLHYFRNPGRNRCLLSSFQPFQVSSSDLKNAHSAVSVNQKKQRQISLWQIGGSLQFIWHHLERTFTVKAYSHQASEATYVSSFSWFIALRWMYPGRRVSHETVILLMCNVQRNALAACWASGLTDVD